MKKIKHLTRVGLLLLAATQALPSVASETKSFDSIVETNQATTDIDKSASSLLQPETETLPTFPSRFGANYSTSGAGFDEFGSIEAFIPVFQSPGQDLTFLEGKLLWATGNNALGGNILLGHRFKSDSGNYLVGGYVSFDSRNTGETVFNQLGAGFESFSENLDFRTNVYLPMGNKSVVLTSTNPGTYAFRGNTLEIDREQLFQQALTGFDAELGTKLASLGSGSLRGYAGLYYYNSENINGFLGVRGRLVARPNDNLVAGLTLQSDSVFDTRLTFTIGASLSGGGSRTRSKNSIFSRINESPQRQSNITVDNVLVKDTVAAVDPSTGNPYNFQHVNLGLGNSNGTIESPFGTIQAALDAAKPGNIVYVRSGTNPGVPAFKIPDGVQVISSAVPMEMKTQIGTVKLPFSASGVLPLIKDTVTLGNNTSLVGFNIANAKSAGIQGSSISNISVKNNTITNSVEQGIFLENAIGKVEIANNSINGTQTELGSGIQIFNSIDNADIKITGNTVENTSADGITTIFSGTATGMVDISQNMVTKNSFSGVVFASGENSQIIANISGNNISKNIFNGISVSPLEDMNSQGTINILNNTSTENGGYGITLSITSQTAINILNNTTNRNRGSGISAIDFGNTSGAIKISENISEQNQEDGISVGSAEDSLKTINILNNTTNRNGNSGINSYFFNVGGTANISGNTSQQNKVAGISIFSSGNSQGTANILNNINVENGYSGIFVVAFDKSQITTNIFNNTTNKNGYAGIDFQTTDNSRGTANISSNISQQNKENGILVSLFDNSQVSANITNNTVTENKNSGIFLYAINNTIANANISKNTASGHTAPDTEGVFIFLADDSQGNLTVTENIITGNLRGITSGANDNAKLRIILEGNNVRGNLTEGIAITGDSDPQRGELGQNQTFAAVRNNTIINNNTSGQGFGDLSVATFSDGSNICLQARNNTIGTLALADTAAPELGFPFNAEPLEFLAGIVRLELPNFLSTNNIRNQNPADIFVWSGTTIPAGNCGLNP
ncbi:MAG: right-handed parallel beta-helix repeat-containing protein [Scytonematopsis contorta HA4267-MV1]|jgi:hypothetical protein|nr:right-handed parallel beta-helix repeat-containing protein [Scytonematopsis contorta HA4267-MV1]